MPPGERRKIAEQKGLNFQAIEEYLQQPQCGQLGEQEIAKFVLDPRQEWSVGFVSVRPESCLPQSWFNWKLQGRMLPFRLRKGRRCDSAF